MRVERLKIGAFGRLRALSSGEAPLPAFVAVHGPNEAGKTTFFHFLTTLLYGFQPATREAHPYAPWEGGEVEGEALLRLDDGEAWQVRRRLRSSPAGSLLRAGVQEDLRNRTLPCAEHVPRAVFRQVFALTLAELAGLEGEGWAAVQDRLLGAMGAGDLRPARQVAAELEREAGEIWRPNRRGRQRARALREDMLGLRERRQAALEADLRLREAMEALEATRRELRALREERSGCRSYVERYRSLLPVRAQLRRIEGFDQEAGDPDDLEGLPADPAAQLGELAARLREVEERLAAATQEAQAPRARVETYGSAEEQLVRRAETVRALAARALALESERVRRAQLEQEIRDLERRAQSLASELVARWDAETWEAVRALDVGALREAVKAYRSAREARRLAEEGGRTPPDPGSGSAGRAPPAWSGWGVATLAAGVLVAGLMHSSVFLTALAGPLLAVGVAALLIGADARRAGGRAHAARRRVDSARAREAEAHRAVRDRLADLPLREAAWSEPDSEATGALERLQELLRDSEDRVGALETLEARARALAEALDALAGELRLELAGEPATSIHLLADRLREAESRREAARVGRRDLERIARQRRRAEEDRARFQSEHDRLRERLERLGGGDAGRGLDAALARMEARRVADRLRDELFRAHPDMDEILRRIAAAEDAGEDWTVDEDALERRRSREEELSDRIEGLARRAEGIERDVERQQEAETADAVEGEVLVLEEQLAEARRERDRLWVLARLVRQAERRFREEHQPDILRRAGAHLAAITGGRYRRILVGDEEGRGTFLLDGPDAPVPVPVGEPISTGTREQVYLALRLAIVDHLDRGGERLPLFMDEAFVNWDPERLERGLEVLEGIAAHRQIFLFTCHPDLADRVERRGAHVLHLGLEA